VLLEGGVEDLFLDGLMDCQFVLDLGEQLLAGLHPTLGRGLEFLKHLLDLVVVLLEQIERVHLCLLVAV
jgi:hypothetical protein